MIKKLRKFTILFLENFIVLNHLLNNNFIVLNHLLKKFQWSNTMKLDPPCLPDKDLVKYLHRRDVRMAIHIPEEVQAWDICNEQVPFTKRYLLLLGKIT